MKITLVQSCPKWEDVTENLRRAERFIAESNGDLVVFPEMFPSGFTMDPRRVAEPMSGTIVASLREWAEKYDKAIMGSVAITERGKYYNRMLFATPDGKVEWYDKRHLFRMSGENGAYTPGEKRVVWKYKDIRMLPVTCYDLRFPVWLRNRDDYDMMVVSASWPAVRAYAWRTLLRARAIENLCYVAAANRGGQDPNATYTGDSALIDFAGDTIAAAEGSGEQVVNGTVLPDEMTEFREKFPAWLDADKFKIEI